VSNLFETTPKPVAYARIAPERGIDLSNDGLTYGLTEKLADLEIGERVIIPLGRGNKKTHGIVLQVTSEPDCPTAKIKMVIERDPNRGHLTEQLVSLAQWMANYYCCPLGVVVGTMLPAAVKKGVGRRNRRFVQVVQDHLQKDDQKALTKLQRSVLEVAQHLDDQPIDPRELAHRAGAKTTSPIRRLIEAGYLKEVVHQEVHATWGSAVWSDTDSLEATITPTDTQQEVIESVGSNLDQQKFSVHVLHGVTGSGKTEIYLRLIHHLKSKNKDAAVIVLVPEISLTPQTAGRFKRRFPNEVAILHSGLTAAQRHEQWSQIERGEVSIVVGARSAVFAPLPDDRLAFIIVDEEHDSSYKQDQAPRYHGRDVAVKRAQLAGATVLLGSATPSLESFANAHDRHIYTWHTLAERVPGMKMPHVFVADMVDEHRKRLQANKQFHNQWHRFSTCASDAKRSDAQRSKRSHETVSMPDDSDVWLSNVKGNKSIVHLLGPTLETELARTLDAGGQAILLLNRRGYANYICCPDRMCGWFMSCLDCDAAMVLHTDRKLPGGGYVQCHHCQTEQRVPEKCPVCGRHVFRLGMGTQRIEEELTLKFPILQTGTTLRRVDSDTMRRASEYHSLFNRFRKGDIRVLVGTQMLAKGHDFPNVRLVGIVNADTAIHMPDFRASERTFQLVSQVSGRAGRSQHAGLVIVQTYQPHLPAIQHAAQHNYIGFAQQEIIDRKTAQLPPITRMARIVIRDRDHLKAKQRADSLAEKCRSISRSMKEQKVTILGPAPCPLSRLSGHHRISIELIAPTTNPIQTLLTTIRNAGLAKSDSTTAIDVDPVSLM